MGAMARAYLSQHRPGAADTSGWKIPAIFWTAVAAGILLKGPLILMLVALPAVVAVDQALALADEVERLPRGEVLTAGLVHDRGAVAVAVLAVGPAISATSPARIGGARRWRP